MSYPNQSMNLIDWTFKRKEEMRLWCWYCHKSVSSELPKDALFRAIAVCPERIGKSPEAENHPLNLEITDEINTTTDS